jgi:hypothetical protein
MTAPVKVNFKLYQGSTFSEVLRWESYTKVYKPITNITKAAPAVVTAIAHGMPVGWRARITGVTGMKEINSEEYVIATESTLDTLTFNSINASGYSTYTSGGILEYNEPKSLAGYTARLQVRAKVTSDVILLECTTENSMIVLNDTNKTITITVPALTTEDLSFKSAVYSMELVSGAVVVPFIYGNITLDTEITR